jgi:hypothetical protein
MTYVLIVLLYFRAGITAEFNSLDKCKAAGEALIRIYPDRYHQSMINYVCVEK